MADLFNTYPFLWPKEYLIWQDYVLENKKLDLPDYEWNMVSVETLRQMRSIMNEKGWINDDVIKTVGDLEYYFYFNIAPKYMAGSTNLEYVEQAYRSILERFLK